MIFALIALMMGYVLVHNERFLIEPGNPMWAHFSNYGWWIITHAMAVVAALFLAPFQFSDRPRQRYTDIHHIVAYVYGGGIFFLAPFGRAPAHGHPAGAVARGGAGARRHRGFRMK